MAEESNLMESQDVHIHFPAGGVGKDGPSAGITMCCALVSELTKMPVIPNLAMTGEITLQGRVLGIGGLKEKLLAAKQHGIKKVLVPQDNFDDAQDVLKETNLEGIQIVFVSTMDEVLAHAFAKSPFKKKTTKKRKPTKKTTN